MKTKVAAIYGKRDVRLREFELPEITDNELLVSVISDSVCLSTWKAALLGSEHKRVPDDLENHPVITGHECAGVIVEVGKNLTGKYKKGQRLPAFCFFCYLIKQLHYPAHIAAKPARILHKSCLNCS